MTTTKDVNSSVLTHRENVEAASQRGQAKRPVRIEKRRDCWLVLYNDRSYRRHYSPAQFNLDHSLSEVEQWVKENPKLELQ